MVWVLTSEDDGETTFWGYTKTKAKARKWVKETMKELHPTMDDYYEDDNKIRMNHVDCSGHYIEAHKVNLIR